ncbi:MAG: hypothetical protein HPY66_3278 [Firmicutes bacterium]|nr:hypothetical protein [Bacillota bacterium]MDI6705284.1 GGDEF domain-containing protein [Bacillota bacterium]
MHGINEVKPAVELTALGEFADRELEKEYRAHDIAGLTEAIKLISLGLGVLYFLFIIPDFFLIRDAVTFRIILANRSVFLLLVVYFATRVGSIGPDRYFYWVTAYEVLCGVFFLQVYYLYETPDFLIQSFGVITIILAIYLVPNRWVLKLGASTAVALGFFTVSALVTRMVKVNQFSAAVVYITLTIVFTGVSSYQINRYKRKHYAYEKELLYLSTIDQLTGIHNRLRLEEELKKNVDYAKRYKADLSIIIFDVDDFKQINDSYGHQVGDSVLAAIASIVKNSVRATDFFARWGGEEFIILLPNTGKQDAVELAHRLKKSISEYGFGWGGNVTCSFGVDTVREDDDVHSIVRRVDRLMYNAKSKGKNEVMA